jgi:hypothetical protein
MWIEHLDPVSLDSGRINDYDNCVYACRFCNRSRATAPRFDVEGRRLLDPGQDAWGQRFSISADRLLPLQDDPDAVYTSLTYELNDPRKVRRRELRRERLETWLKTLKEGPAAIQRLRAQANRTDSQAEAETLLNMVEILRANISYASTEIQRYLAVPSDADPACPCGSADHHHLPEWLAAQIQIVL